MLQLQGISKSFGAVRALIDVDLEVQAGEVRALLGSNGAGKSTLMRIVSGAESRDTGQMVIAGKQMAFESTAAAANSGVAAVYQELSLVPGLTVAENIMLGRWRKRPFTAGAVIDMKAMQFEAQAALDRLGVPLRSTAIVEDLSVGQQQLVEIAKALSQDPRLLILDEPTSALSRHDADRLIGLVRGLSESGMAILYVSHRMEEISRVADTMTIMRDGRVVTTVSTTAMTVDQVAQKMIGEQRELAVATRSEPPKETVRLSVQGLTKAGSFADVSFRVREGEVLGIAGLLGSGRTELLRCIFGRDRFDSGAIEIDGHPVPRPSERRMIRLGVGFTPEDRKSQGAVLGLPISSNLTLASLQRFSRAGLLNRSRERELAVAAARDLTVRAGSLDDPLLTLSGGNQQKVVIGKWIVAGSQILLLDEPTRGIDIHAKQQVYELVRSLAAKGCSVVFVSSELEELFSVCHTIGVMNHGRLTNMSPVSETTLQETLALAMKEVVVDERTAAGITADQGV